VTRPRAKRGEGDRLGEEILAAASDLLLKTGDEDAVSVRAVAAAVGVTPPSIYLHFADKDELLVAVCERQFRAFNDFVEEAVAGIDDPVARLMRRGEAYVQFGVQHPEHYRILFMAKTASVMSRGKEALSRASGFDMLMADVEACMDAGAFRRDDVLLVASGLWAVVHGVTSLAISVPGFPEVGLDRLVAHACGVYGVGLSRFD
jgi:AcrR family transcriptional regulator